MAIKFIQRLSAMLLAAGAALAWCETARAQSVGCFGMPSRASQYFGYGYGAGHHAPIVRSWGQHPSRVPRNVHVPAAQGPLYPAPYAPVGCYGQFCEPAPPYSEAYPEPVPAPEPAAADAREAWRPFGRK